MKAALIGCGKIADQHASNIKKLVGAELTAVCDREILMAKQLAERFGIENIYTSAEKMLAKERPDVVHITTPPQSHLPLGILCLEAGCHVFMEKPFTINAEEARRLLDLATEKGRKMTVGQNAQFSHAAIRMRQLIDGDFIGGRPVHLENIFCYDVRGALFAGAFLADPDHWVRKLPGQLLHNIISHGIGQIVEHLGPSPIKVRAEAFISEALKNRGEDEILDELRVFIRDGNDTTANFIFSSSIAPSTHRFEVFGKKGSLVLDDDHQIVLRRFNRAYRSPVNQLFPPLLNAGQYVAGAWRNLWSFLRRDFHSDARTRFLIDAFYRSIKDDTALPIPFRDILRTTQIMDDIFDQIYPLPKEEPFPSSHLRSVN